MIRTLARNFAGIATLMAGFAALSLSPLAQAQIVIPNPNQSFSIFTDGRTYTNQTAAQTVNGISPGETFGIFQITSVFQNGTLFKDDGSVYYYGIIHDGMDAGPFGGDLFDISGLVLDIYKVSGVNDSGDHYWDALVASQLSGVNATGNGFAGISTIGTTAGELALTTAFSSTLVAHGTTGGDGLIHGTGISGTATGIGGIFNVTAANNTGFTTPQIPLSLQISIGNQPPSGLVTDPATNVTRFDSQISANLVNQPVPEPSTYGLMGVTALAAMIGVRRRKQKSAVAAA